MFLGMGNLGVLEIDFLIGGRKSRNQEKKLEAEFTVLKYLTSYLLSNNSFPRL